MIFALTDINSVVWSVIIFIGIGLAGVLYAIVWILKYAYDEYEQH